MNRSTFRIEPLRVAWYRDAVMDIVLGTDVTSPLPTTPTHTLETPVNSEFPPISNSSLTYKPHARYHHLPTKTVSVPEDDWREYLQQQTIRVAILVVASTLTILLNQAVYPQLRHADFPGVIYWHVVYIALFVLSIVWFLMLVVLVVEVVWYLVRTPLATKRSMYQRLFDF